MEGPILKHNLIKNKEEAQLSQKYAQLCLSFKPCNVAYGGVTLGCHAGCMQPALRPSGPRGKGVKQFTLGIKRSKVKITRGRGYIGRPGGGIVLEFF